MNFIFYAFQAIFMALGFVCVLELWTPPIWFITTGACMGFAAAAGHGIAPRKSA